MMMLFIWGFIVVLIIGIVFAAKKGIKQGNELKEQTKSIGALQGYSQNMWRDLALEVSSARFLDFLIEYLLTQADKDLKSI